MTYKENACYIPFSCNFQASKQSECLYYDKRTLHQQKLSDNSDSYHWCKHYDVEAPANGTCRCREAQKMLLTALLRDL